MKRAARYLIAAAAGALSALLICAILAMAFMPLDRNTPALALPRHLCGRLARQRLPSPSKERPGISEIGPARLPARRRRIACSRPRQLHLCRQSGRRRANSRLRRHSRNRSRRSAHGYPHPHPWRVLRLPRNRHRHRLLVILSAWLRNQLQPGEAREERAKKIA